MWKVIVLFLALSFTSCQMFSSPRASLSTIQDAAIAARMTVRPVIDAACAEELRKCKGELQARFADADMDCPGYDVCHQIRLIVIRTLEAVQFAIADANLALALGQSDRYDEAVERATELLIDVQRQMQLLGVIPDEESDDAG